MSSADTETTAEAAETDEVREALLAEILDLLGDAVVESHVEPGRSLTIRVDRDRWVEVHRTLRDTGGFKFFEFLSAIDWLPSPFGKSEDAAVDLDTLVTLVADPGEPEQGYAGGDTRFQVFTRLVDITRDQSPGVVIKTDVDEPRDGGAGVGTLVGVFPGANWHEREIHEMFGIVFDGHPHLQPLYLPSEFEGNPLRKDFPLLARHVKPWPGIVDVEPMPGGDDDDSEGGDDS